MSTVTSIVIEALIKSALMVFVLATGFAYLTLAERKIAAFIQVRKGPNRVGPWGLLQPAADGIKLLFKEEMVPAGADKILFFLAPILTMIPAIVIMAVVPIGPDVELFGRVIHLSVSDLNVGMLYILSVASVAVYGIVLAGWSSANKYALFGAMRAIAALISYEIPLVLSVVGVLLLTGSMSLIQIVEAQRIPFILLQPLGFFLLLATKPGNVSLPVGSPIGLYLKSMRPESASTMEFLSAKVESLPLSFPQ